MYYLPNTFAVSPDERERLCSNIMSLKNRARFLNQLKAAKLKRIYSFYEELNENIDPSDHIRAMLYAAVLLTAEHCNIVHSISDGGVYKLNSEAFELTFCENLGQCLKNAYNKKINIDTCFDASGFTVSIAYAGGAFTPAMYMKNGRVVYTKTDSRYCLKITVDAKNQVYKSFSDNNHINEDGLCFNRFLLDRMSAVYIGLRDILYKG